MLPLSDERRCGPRRGALVPGVADELAAFVAADCVGGLLGSRDPRPVALDPFDGTFVGGLVWVGQLEVVDVGAGHPVGGGAAVAASDLDPIRQGGQCRGG